MKKILAILASFSFVASSSASLISFTTIETNDKKKSDNNPEISLKELNTSLSVFTEQSTPKKITIEEFWEYVDWIENVLKILFEHHGINREVEPNNDYIIDFDNYFVDRIISLWINPDLKVGLAGIAVFNIVDSIQSDGYNLEINVTQPYINEEYVYEQVQKRIQDITLHDQAKLGIDYTIESFSLNSWNKKTLGLVKVSATPDSIYLTGEFNIHFYMHLDTSKYKTTGSSSLAKRVKDDIVNEILLLNPMALEGIDYEIIPYEIFNYVSGSFRIRSIGKNPTIVLDFTFKVNELIKVDISNNGFSRYIDDDNGSQSKIRLEVREILKGSISQPLIENVDYKINIPFKNGRATKVGKFTVEATKLSKIIKGSFYINIYKKIDTNSLPKQGSNLLWQQTRDKLIAMIESWYETPLKDQYVIDEVTKTIKSTSNSFVVVDYSFKIV